MRMIATQSFAYRAGALLLKPGDRFEAEEKDARLLKAWNKAIDDPGGALTGIRAAAAKAEAEAQPPRRGRYRRVDLRAEE